MDKPLVVLLDDWAIDSAGNSLPRRVSVQSQRFTPAKEARESLIELGDFRIDVDRHQVRVRDVKVHLTPKEFDLMLCFARHPDRVLTHKALLRAVWGTAGVGPEYLRVLVAQLRKKIERGREPQYLLSEPWVGYRLSPGPANRGDACQAQQHQ